VKNCFEFKMALIVGLVCLIYLIPFSSVDAAKFQSGVTIKANSNTPSDQCIDANKDTVDDNTGETCGKAPAQPPGKCVDADQNGLDDKTGAGCTGGQTMETATCGLRINGGVPISYGELSIGQESGERMVEIMNDGNSQTPAKVMIKGSDWISDEPVAGANVRIAGPEATRVGLGQGSFAQKTSLSNNGLELGQMTGGQSLPVTFQFKLDNAPNGQVGAFHQDVTIDLLC
jgi:hypothetical protein